MSGPEIAGRADRPADGRAAPERPSVEAALAAPAAASGGPAAAAAGRSEFDLAALDQAALRRLCDDLRDYVSGGGAPLGAYGLLASALEESERRARAGCEVEQTTRGPT